MARWKIFIEYGEQREFDVLDEKVFETKKQAAEFCKSNPLGLQYPLKCIMREDEWERRKIELEEKSEKKKKEISAKNSAKNEQLKPKCATKVFVYTSHWHDGLEFSGDIVSDAFATREEAEARMAADKEQAIEMIDHEYGSHYEGNKEDYTIVGDRETYEYQNDWWEAYITECEI